MYNQYHRFMYTSQLTVHVLWAIWDCQENLTRVAKLFLTASLEIHIYGLCKIEKVEKNKQNSLNSAQKAINSFSSVYKES